MLKNERGITMISLAATIVIMLILTAATISFTVDENSSMNRAVESTNESKVASVQELFQFYVSDDYADEKDVFVSLITKGYVKKISNLEGESIFYITKTGIENIAPNFADTTSDEYIYQVLPELETNDEVTISDEQFEMLKDTDVYLVDRSLSVAYLTGEKMYGNVVFAESEIISTDKWWVAESNINKQEIIKKVTVDNILYEASNITGEAKILGTNQTNISSNIVFPESIVVEFSETEKMEVRVSEIVVDAFATSKNVYLNCNTVSFPDSLKVIGAGAFSGQSNMKTITLGTGLIEIGDGAFKNCSNLHGVFAFPPSLKTIGKEAFYQLQNGEKAFDFAQCTKLESISERAFYGCNSIKILNFPEGLKEIKEQAFANCMNCKLTDLIFPRSLTKIGTKAFDNFYNITGNIVLRNPNTTYETNSFRSDYLNKIVKVSN